MIIFRGLYQRIAGLVANWICANIVIGGHCGLCGKWVPNCLLPRWWPITICDDCRKIKDDKKGIVK